jgi:4-amino-4-deoxy-L-arabinose transferase-like glycosyltransferase
VRSARSSPGRRAARTAAGILALAAVATAALFLDLGRPALWDPGEGRYAQTVREMLLTRDWIVPTLNHERYFDKPPGYYWLVAVSFELFGMTEWAARLPSAVAGALTIAATVVFAWPRLGAWPALCAGAILATAIQFVILGRSVRMDMPLTLLLTVTLFYGFSLWQGGGPRRRPTWPLYVLPALGLLLKGPVALLLPALVLGSLALVTGERERLRRLRPGVGALVALAILAAWHVATVIRAPDYVVDFLWHQNVGRFVEAATGHREPLWYFAWMLPVTFLPWALFLPGAIRRALRRARCGHDLELFLLLWSAAIGIFFSLSRAKLATYVLPIFPPLALLVAVYLTRVIRAPAAVRARALQAPALVWAGGLAAVAVATPIAIALLYPGFGRRAGVSLLLLPFALAGVAVIRRGWWRALPAMVLVAALATQVLFYRTGASAVSEFSSLRAAAEAARDLPSSAPVFAYKTRGHSFVFYSGRPLRRVRSPASAAAALARGGPVALLTKARYLTAISRHLREPAHVWWRSPSGRLLIANLPRTPARARSAPALGSGDPPRPRRAGGSPAQPGGLLSSGARDG